MRRTHKKAFTLIELLVVVAIISLLMTIIVPALRRVKEQATGSVCLSNVKQITLAWHTYTMDSDAVLVNGHVPTQTKVERNNNMTYWVEPPQNEAGNYRGGSNVVTAEFEQKGIERGALFPYINAIDVYKCPGDRSQMMFNLPNAAWLNSYSVTGLMNGEQVNSSRLAKKMSDITAPGSKVVFLENMDDRGWAMGSWIMNYSTPAWIDPIAIWHRERGSLGFADGHAEMRNWVDRTTIENAEKGFPLTNTLPRAGESGDDVRFMQQAYVPGRR